MEYDRNLTSVDVDWDFTNVGEAMSNTTSERDKAIVLEAFQALFNRRDYKAAERLWSPNYIQHSAHIPAGRGGLLGLIRNLPPTLKYEPGVIVADGDYEVKIKGGSAMGSPVVRSTNVFKRKSMRFVAALLAALAGLVAVPNAALAAVPQHHDQQPGFYRLKVGDLEVTALYDGTRAFDPQWLDGTKATMDGVVKGLNEDPHVLDVVDSGFLVNTGKQLILVDAGAGTWWGGGALGRLVGSLRSAGYTPEEIDVVLVTHLHSDHVGGLTTQDGKRVFPNADVYVAKAESDFWLSPEIAAKAPKNAQPFFQSAQAIAAPYIKAGKWHTFTGSETIVDGMQLVPLPGHTPGHTGYEFSSMGQKILFWGDTIHAQRVQFPHPEVTAVFDIDPAAAAATRNQLLPKLAGADVLIAGPHSSVFPPVGRLRKEGSGYSWVPVVFTDRWNEHAPSSQK